MALWNDGAGVNDGFEVAKFGMQAAFRLALHEALGLQTIARIRSATEIIRTPCSLQNSANCGTRAMDPSSFMISQTTPPLAQNLPAAPDPLLLRFVRLAPAHRPGWHARGKCVRVEPNRLVYWLDRWPRGWYGREVGCGDTCGDALRRFNGLRKMLCRSGELLREDIGGSCSASQISGLRGRQIKPRAWRAMKLMTSGVTFSAATVMSPSFSRSSSSTMTSIRPRSPKVFNGFRDGSKGHGLSSRIAGGKNSEARGQKPEARIQNSE